MKKLLLFCMFTFACAPSLQAQIITTFAGIGPTGVGSYSGDGGLAIDAGLNDPSGIASDSAGNVYIGEEDFHIRKVSVTGIITTIAGTGVLGYTGDNGPATAAEMGESNGVAMDRTGNLYFADGYNLVVRKVSPSGIITTFAGNGAIGYSGDGGQATMAGIGINDGIAVDSSGNLYLPGGTMDRVRMVTTATGIITTIAGTGVAGYGGDGGPATADSVLLNSPTGVAADRRGNIYITDLSNYRIRKVNAAGIITTFAGTGTAGYTGDGGPATNAQLKGPWGIAVDDTGSVFISDLEYVRKIDTFGVITTFAGNGIVGFFGDGGPATAAEFDGPRYVAASRAGQGVYISDDGNNRIRRVGSPVHAPFFINGEMQNDTVCPAPVALDTLLKAFEADTGDIVTWTVISGPFHGSAFTPYTVWSAGDTLYTAGLTYVPATGYTGHDTLTVWLTNGYASDTTTIYLTVLPCISAVPALSAAEHGAVELYPNPNNGTFNFYLSSNSAEEASIVITDIVGETIKEMTVETNHATEILIDAPPGVYFLNAATEEGDYNKKIIVEK